MARLATSTLREKLADALNRVAYKGERIVLERRGRDIAALVSLEDLAFLEELEDRLDVETARKALADMEASGEKPIPWEDLKRDLGLQ